MLVCRSIVSDGTELSLSPLPHCLHSPPSALLALHKCFFFSLALPLQRVGLPLLQSADEGQAPGHQEDERDPEEHRWLGRQRHWPVLQRVYNGGDIDTGGCQARAPHLSLRWPDDLLQVQPWTATPTRSQRCRIQVERKVLYAQGKCGQMDVDGKGWTDHWVGLVN